MPEVGDEQIDGIELSSYIRLMLPDYRDITKRILESPLWYTEHGVPRYDAFRPDMLGIYDVYAALYEIACRACDKHMLVGVGKRKWDYTQVNGRAIIFRQSLEKLIKDSGFVDPPSHGCVGDGMMCSDLRVVEAWQKINSQWVRYPDLELVFVDERLLTDE